MNAPVMIDLDCARLRMTYEEDEEDQAFPMRRPAVRAMVTWPRRCNCAPDRCESPAALHWPSSTEEVGVDEMADILRYAPRGSC